MTIRPRHGYHTCTSCRTDVHEAISYAIGEITFSLCVRCAKRLQVVNRRAIKQPQEAAE